ncbi:MAG: hypothetical protein ABW184_06130 [Sphingobium sp.]
MKLATRKRTDRTSMQKIRLSMATKGRHRKAAWGLTSRAFARQREFMLLTPEMSRAARALLKWKPQQLATAAGLDVSVVERFEDDGIISPASVEAMLETLRGAGLKFIAAGGKSLDGGPGLRTIPKPEPEVAAAEEVIELEAPLLPPAVDI